jgi:hypothetical protein
MYLAQMMIVGWCLFKFPLKFVLALLCMCEGSEGKVFEWDKKIDPEGTKFSNHHQHRCVFQFELSIQKLGGLHARD